MLAGIFILGSCLYSDEVNFRVGGNIGSWYSETGNLNTGNAEDFGFEFTVEYMKEIVPNFKLGLGTGYQANPKVEGKNTEIEYWFGNTKCIYTSCHDLISKILQFD